MKFKKRVFEIIQIGNKEDIPSRIFDYFIAFMVVMNISCMFLETFEELSAYTLLFHRVEVVTIAVFCIEYLLRIWTADLLYPQKGGWKARLRFLVSYDGVVDLLTILPVFCFSGFIAFRMLRVVRIFHLFRFNAQYDSFNIIMSVLYEKRNSIISSVFIIILLMLASSLGIYSAEHIAQPEAFPNAFSGIWWSVSTMLTVGYGDVCPVTTAGKILAILTAFLGVGAVAIPTGIISAGFVEQYSKKQNAALKFNDVREIGEVAVDEGHPFLGKSVHEIENEYDIKLMLVLREEYSILATGDIIVKKGDIIIVKSPQIVKEGETPWSREKIRNRKRQAGGKNNR